MEQTTKISRAAPEPKTIRRELEKQAIKESRVLSDIERINKQITFHYALRHFNTCYNLANVLADLHRELAKLLYHTEYLLGKLANEGKAPKSQGFDYTQFDGFPD